MGMPNQTAQRLMYGYLRDGYRDVALFPVDLCRGQVHELPLQYGALTRYCKPSTRLLCPPTSAIPRPRTTDRCLSLSIPAAPCVPGYHWHTLP